MSKRYRRDPGTQRSMNSCFRHHNPQLANQGFGMSAEMLARSLTYERVLGRMLLDGGMTNR